MASKRASTRCKSLAIIVDPATKFQLEKQIQDEDAQLAKLEQELDTIEASLLS